MHGHINVRTLGTAAIEVGSRRLGPSSGRLFALVLYLASLRGHATSRRIVQELLFPEANGHAAHNLRQLLYRLRQLGIPIDTDADQLCVRLEDVSVDWWQLVDSGKVGETDLQQLALGVFPGYSPDISDAFREWFEVERAEICRRLGRHITRHLGQLRASGRWDLVDTAARALLALDPLSEEGTLARAEVLAVAGSKSAALGLIDQYMIELGETQPHLRLAPSTLKRRISERLPEVHHRSIEDRLFVGREQMMRMLHAVATAARSCEQQVLLLWGEPGIGKTRLLTEFRALMSVQGAVTVQLASQSHDIYRPLGIACDLIAPLLQAPGALGCDPAARTLLERLVSAETATSSTGETAAAEAPLSAIMRSLADLVGAVASECPVVALVDDAQWLDEGSLRTLLGVFGDRVSRRSCLILASRDRTLLAGSNNYTDAIASVRLNPLERDAALELIRTLLQSAGRDGVEQIDQRVLEQGRGNPFFIRLLCSHFLSTNDAASLNHTLTEILERRLEQLSRDATRTLEACVILAKNCSFNRLEQVLEIARHQLLTAIEELDDRGLIEVSDGFIVSSHALLSEAVQRRMAPSVKQLLHTATATILQEEIDSSAGHLQWDCAEHWRLAGSDERAIKVLIACAQRIFEIGRPEDAIETYRRALAMRASDQLRLELVESALNTMYLSLNYINGRELFLELRHLRMELGLPVRSHDKFEILEFAHVLHSGEDPRGNVQRLNDCMACTTTTAHHRGVAASQLMMIADLTRDSSLAKKAFEATLSLTAENSSQIHRELVYHSCFGDPEQALRRAKSLATLLSDANKPERPSDVRFLINIGYAHYRVGEANVSASYLAKALALACRYEMISAEIMLLDMLVQLYWASDRLADARKHHEQLSQLASQETFSTVAFNYCLFGCRIAIHEHRFDEGRRFIQQALTLPHALLDAPRMSLLACDILLDLSKGQDGGASDPRFLSLLGYHYRARAFGEQDDIVIVLLRVLIANSECATAAQLWRDYLSVRREKFQPRSELRCIEEHLHGATLRH